MRRFRIGAFIDLEGVTAAMKLISQHGETWGERKRRQVGDVGVEGRRLVSDFSLPLPFHVGCVTF